ncbi:ComEC/Rec2 family competence protein [Cellulomonas fimi]|uniref:ComEC/Rec2 family competence protein n=1 Tax=Cellulomonas fimi TaxID=1708 RepID=A0A7Y0LWR2_CELFI|nr:ComEC/Rec2 family competence protein [Cellulomonas fimi]NMR19329.1 ComEC/Rec2 family competence protein [Cellulomonas fimi]
MPAALATWCTAFLVVLVPAGTATAIGGAATLAGGVVAATALRRRTPARAPTATRTGTATRTATAPRGRRAALRGQAVLVLLAAAATAFTAAAQLGQRDAGLLGRLVEERATVSVVGTVRSEPMPLAAPSWSAGGERYRVVLTVEHVTGRGLTGAAAGRVLVLGNAPWAGASYGARAQVAGRLQPVDDGDPVVALLIAGELRVVEPPGPIDLRVGRIRRSLLEASDDLSPDARGLVPGIAVGDTSRIPDDLDEAMRVTGLTHLTAVSGAHFAIVAAVVLGLTGLVGLPRSARAVVVAVVMVGFVLLVHPEPSVVRAAAMGAVGVGGLLLGRPARALPALAVAGTVLLLLDPWLARSYGFVLSVVATAGIVVLTEPLARRLGAVLPQAVAYVVAVPLAAQLACAPIVVLLSAGLASYAVPANVVAAPAVAPATVAGVLAALVAPWWPAAGTALAHVAGAATWWISGVARVAAGLPLARLPWPEGPPGAVLLAAITVLTGAAVLGTPALSRVGPGGRWLAACCAALAAGIAVAWASR